MALTHHCTAEDTDTEIGLKSCCSRKNAVERQKYLKEEEEMPQQRGRVNYQSVTILFYFNSSF